MPDAEPGIASPVSPGDIVAGRYRVERVIGAGGMGVIVAARHEALDQRVAIKFLLSSGRVTDASVRFLREARAAARLRSDHVARVFDVATHESGVPFMVMEYLEGCDLASELETRGPLPVAESVDYVLQALDAVAEAHAAGIVHRDLKPSNLFLDTQAGGTRRVKVLDFGISKNELVLSSAPSVTSASALLGSPMYMSPEQVQNAREVDARADLWSLGVVLYELLTGAAPFDGQTVGAIFTNIVKNARIPLSARRADVPLGLQAVVDRCLASERDARYASAAELAEALAPFGSGGSAAIVRHIATIAGGGSAQRASHAQPKLVAAGVTEATWTGRGASVERGGRRRWLVPALALVAALGAGGWWLERAHGRLGLDGSVPIPEAAPTANAAEAARVPTLAPASAPPTATASAVATEPTASAAPAASAPAPQHPTAPPRARPPALHPAAKGRLPADARD